MRDLARFERVGYGTALAVLLCTVPAMAQDVYVHARVGCDQNSGALGAPVQTLTQGLVIASGMTPPVTIHVAGAAVPGTGPRIPYDDLANNPVNPPCAGPQGAETFPLGMLPAVSLVWDVANSDSVGVQVQRPLISHSAPLSFTLIDFSSATYTPGATPVTLDGLDIEFGGIGVNIPNNPAGPVQPSLSNLNVFDCQMGLYANANGGTLDIGVADSTFQIRASTPFTPSNPLLVFLQALSGGRVGASISNSKFEAEPPKFASSAVRANASLDGTIEVTIDASRFEGGTSLATPSGQGLGVGLLAGSSVGGGGANLSSLLLTVRDSSFTYCQDEAIDVDLVGSSGVTQANPSSATVVTSAFSGNRRSLVGPAMNQGQIVVGVEGGRALDLQVSNNSFRVSPAHGVFLWNTNPALPGVVAGEINATISSNDLRGPHTDGIRFQVEALIVSGTVSGNTIFDVTGDGIENFVMASTYAKSESSPVIVNNMIAYTGGHGIHNRLLSPGGPLQKFAAEPPITHTTVAMAGGAGLFNYASGAPVPRLRVTNSIFRGSGYPGGFDIVDGVAGAYVPNPGGPGFPNMTVTFCDFLMPNPAGTVLLPVGPNFNVSDPPSFVSPTLRDFHIASGSYMRDFGTNTPPASPALDFDGNLRRIDLAGVPNGPNGGFADLGADERTIP